MKKTLMAALAVMMTSISAAQASDDVPDEFVRQVGDEMLTCSVISLAMRREDAMHVEVWTNRHYALKQYAKEMYLDVGPPLTKSSFDQMFAAGVGRFVSLEAVDKQAMHASCGENYQEADRVCREAEAECPYPAQN